MPSKNLRTDPEWVSESLSHVRLFAAPWTEAYQAPLSIEFPRQEYWSGLPLPSLGNLFHPGIEPLYPTLAEPLEDSECWTNFKSLTPQSSHSHISPKFLVSTAMEMANHRVIQIDLFLLQCQPCHECCFFCCLFSAVSGFLPFSPSLPKVIQSFLPPLLPSFFFFLKKNITSFFFFVTFIFVYQGFLFSHLCSLGTSNCMVKIPAGNDQN